MYLHDCGFNDAVEFITGEPRPSGRKDETTEQREAREQRHRDRQGADDARAASQARADSAKLHRDEEAVAGIRARCKPIAGTHAAAYLAARGLTPPKRLTRDLLFVEALDYRGYAHEGATPKTLLATLPALVAIVRDVAGDEIGIHQTYLDPHEPTKWAAMPDPARNPAKKVRKRGERVTGGIIRLGAITDTLVVAEGLETCLSYLALGLAPDDASFACALSLGNLCGRSTGMIPHPLLKDEPSKFAMIHNGVPDMNRPGVILPVHVTSLVICGDGDSEQIATAARLLCAVRRFRSQGLEVRVAMAPPGFDWNDVLVARGNT